MKDLHCGDDIRKEQLLSVGGGGGGSLLTHLWQLFYPTSCHRVLHKLYKSAPQTPLTVVNIYEYDHHRCQFGSPLTGVYMNTTTTGVSSVPLSLVSRNTTTTGVSLVLLSLGVY